MFLIARALKDDLHFMSAETLTRQSWRRINFWPFETFVEISGVIGWKSIFENEICVIKFNTRSWCIKTTNIVIITKLRTKIEIKYPNMNDFRKLDPLFKVPETSFIIDMFRVGKTTPIANSSKRYRHV